MKRTRRFAFVAAAAITAVVTIAAIAAPEPEPQQRAPRAGVPFRVPAASAPQAELDAALYVAEPFFDVQVRLPRPYAEARPLVAALAGKHPGDARVQLRLAWLDERLGRFDEATAEMERFAQLAGREPNALRRLATYYQGRTMAAEEVRVLDELATKLPPRERGPALRRAIAAYNDGRPQGVDVDKLYDRLIDADPDDGEALREYVSLLLASNDAARAKAAVERASKAAGEPSRETRRTLLAERARIHDRLGARREALDVYESAFDPLWPRAIASDYYTLLSRYGLYRERRRALQVEVSAGNAPLAKVARLFNIYAYEGNLPAAARLLEAVEATRTSWAPADLELASSLYAQVGDFDQSSRFLYSLYVNGGFAPASADRERVLSRLFTALVSANDRATRLAPGGISLYADVARVDQRPGALNGLLSLVLAGNNPAAEYAAEEARVGGYLNRALAFTIYEQVRREYPASPHLGVMTLDLLDAYSDLNAQRDVATAGAEFLAKFPNSPEYEAVALAVADAHVRLKDRRAERAVLVSLMDRTAARAPAGKPLLDRNKARWIYGPEVETGADGEAIEDAPPDLFVAPNGTPVPLGRAGRFGRDDSSEPDEDYEPASDSWEYDSEYRSTPDDYRGEPDVERQRPTYAELLERTVSSFEADQQQAAALALFWGEVKKHPKDEGLHERFLSWLGGASLINEQLRAYQLALERYDDGTWLHRFARWHVRRGRAAELKRLTEQVIATLDDEATADYLREFAGYAKSPKGDALNWDNAVELQVARIAHTRFPNNPVFAQTMLARLADAKQWEEWERLSREQYFGDPEIRAAYLERLSQTGKLAEVHSAARERAAGGLEGGATSSFAYAVLAADAARWLSRHDEAMDAYRRLVALYPGERSYAEPLADLERSFGSRDPQHYVEAAKVLDALAAIYPSDRTLPTRAGESLAEAGRIDEAGKRWRQITVHAPGSPAARLELATVFWDYYQFDDAAAELLAIRTQTHDDSLYAFRLGAVYDSKRDIKRAIPEYVKTLAEPGPERNSAMVRLAELSTRAGVLDQIAAAYQAERATRPDRWQLALGYADLLRALNRSGEAIGVLNREVEKTRDVVFLAEARDRFKSWRSPESEERALRRIVDESRDERERIRGQLQLSAFLEQQGRKGDAITVVDKLVSDNPTNVGVLEEATRFYWRTGVVDRSVDLSRVVIGKAHGEYKKRFVMELARRLHDAGRLADAEATLRSYFTENPLDMAAFDALADVLGTAKRDDALAALYAEALKRIRESNLSDEEERDMVASLRTGMIASLTKLGRTAEGVDQHIEIVNRDPENAEALDTAFDYAARYDLTPRFVAYYEKLAKESFKDYRWSLVLSRIYDRTGNTAGAAEALARAVVNEPQRLDLRGDLADALVRAGKEEDAVGELRRAWEIDGREPEWLVRVARIRARQGRFDDAAKAVDEAVASRATTSTSRIFAYAKIVSEWGMLDKSVALYEQGIERAKAKPQNSDLDSQRLAEYVNVAARLRAPADQFARLEAYRREFIALAGKGDVYASSSAKSFANAVEEVERNAFGRAVVDYASTEERAALDSAVRNAGTSAALVDDKRVYLGLSQTGGLPGAEEAIQQSIVATYLTSYAADKGAAFRSALTELSDMYSRRAQFGAAAVQLKAWRARDPQQSDFDYDHRIAEAYRLAGDAENEIATLSALYAAGSGDLRAADNEYTVAVERLLNLLVTTNQRDRLVALAATRSPYQFTLINFLIKRGDEELARRAIATANVSPIWVRAKTAEVGLYFRNASPEVEAAFRDALAVKPIGELVGRKYDPATMLTGDDYYLTARNYGLWLDIVANRPDAARDYVVGRVEERPRDAAAQAQLARYYLLREKPALALAHADLAGELAPTDPSIVVVRGEALYAAGRVDDAIKTWSRLLEGDAVDATALSYYFSAMSAHNQYARALEALRPIIAARTAAGKFADVRQLVADMGAFGQLNPDTWPKISDALYGFAVDATDDIVLLKAVLEGDLVPPDRRVPFYRLLTDRLEGLAAAIRSNPNADTGVWLGEEEYIYPEEELLSWRRAAVDFLIERGSLQEASTLLDAIEAERRETAGGLYDEDESEDYSWVELARATVHLKSNRKAEALAALERYASPGVATVDVAVLPNRNRTLQAVEVLRASGADAEADTMLQSVYRRLIDARQFDDANFTGLAEVLYRRGRGDEADATLRRLVSRKPDSIPTLVVAADAAARSGRIPIAIDLYERVGRISRADARNALELARLRLAAGDAAKGIGGLVEVVSDERAPNSVRAQAIELVAELARRDAGARSTAAGLLGGARSEPSRVLAALVAAAGGDVDGARRSLEAMSGPGASPIATIALGRLEMGSNRTGAAIVAFERSLAVDDREQLASEISFGGPMPADALIELYTASGRPDAALAIAAARTSTYDAETGETTSFEPDVRERPAQSGIVSLGSRNWDARRAGRARAIGALAEAAAAVGRWDEAVAYARRRVNLLDSAAPERPAAEKRYADLQAASLDASRRSSGLLRIGSAIASESVAIREFTLD